MPLPDEFRFYLLVTITGWTAEQIDSTPAEVCDWLIAIHGEVESAKAEAEAKRAGHG